MSRAIRHRQEIKVIQIRKEVKLSLITSTVLLQKIPNESIKNLVEIGEYSKMAGYKNQHTKPHSFLYTNKAAKQSKKIFPLHNCFKRLIPRQLTPNQGGKRPRKGELDVFKY